MYLAILTVAFLIFVISESALLWVNNKGRFRYDLETSDFWIKMDKRIGKLSLVLDVVLTLVLMGLVFLAIAIPVFVIRLQVPLEIAGSFIIFGAIGFKICNAAVDHLGVQCFEKECLKCRNAEKCLQFLVENGCLNKKLIRRVKRAVREQKKQKA